MAVDIPIVFAIRDYYKGMPSDFLSQSVNYNNITVMDSTGSASILGFSLYCISGIDCSEDVDGRFKLDSKLPSHLNSTEKTPRILLSFEWPELISIGASQAARAYHHFGSKSLRKFINVLKANHVISIGENVEFHRESFLLDNTPVRFSSLENFNGNLGGWTILDTTDVANNHTSQHLTPHPIYSEVHPADDSHQQGKRALPPGYICRICHQPGHFIKNCPKIQQDHLASDQTKKSKLDNECWFCLGNPQCRRHLIIDVGEHWYLALAHGGINETHMLLLPIEHVSSTDHLASQLQKEREKWLQRIKMALEKKDLDMVIFSVHLNSQHHWHESIIGIPRSMVKDFPQFLAARSTALGFPLAKTVNPLEDAGKYFSIACKIESYHYKIESGFFPADIGRRLLLEFLNLNLRLLDWRVSTRSESDEIAFVNSLRAAIKIL